MSQATPAHKRVLLKLSGEALMGDDPFGINRDTIVRMVDRGMPLQQAVAAPRFHHQWRPDQLFVETRGGSFALPAPRIADLRQLGHTVVPMPYAGATQCVGYSVSGKLIAVTEPRLSHATVSTAKDGR